MSAQKPAFCKRVIFWGQYGPTCWFNALLMSVLYSQYSRNVVYQKSRSWDQRIELFRLLRYVLKYKYLKTKNPEKDYKFFHTMSPEVILEMLAKIEPKYLPKSFKEGYFSALFISKLYKILGVDCLMLSVINNKINYDMYNHLKKVDVSSNGIKIEYDIKSKQYVTEKLNQHKNPSILLINNSTSKDKIDRHMQRYNRQLQYNIPITNDTKDLLTLKDKITYNGEEYVLDSILLANWNVSANIPGHAIAGITCNNQRYVFNGWTRYTTDPALIYNNLNTKYDKKEKLEMQKVPCELMKYDWNQFTGSDFCINPKQCSLMKANKKDHYKNMCFSFSKGERTFIYVKKSGFANLKHLDLAHTPKHRSYNLSSISHTTTDVKQIKPSVRKPQLPKECPPDKIRNPVTGRCISMKTAEKRNLVKGKDNNDKKVKNKVDKKPKDTKPKIINKKGCVDGKIRDPNTGRCISLDTALKRGLVVTNKRGGGWKIVNPLKFFNKNPNYHKNNINRMNTYNVNVNNSNHDMNGNNNTDLSSIQLDEIKLRIDDIEHIGDIEDPLIAKRKNNISNFLNYINPYIKSKSIDSIDNLPKEITLQIDSKSANDILTYLNTTAENAYVEDTGIECGVNYYKYNSEEFIIKKEDETKDVKLTLKTKDELNNEFLNKCLGMKTT
jgi:hypothetical protein